MLQKSFLCVGIKDLNEVIEIHIVQNEIDSMRIKCFAFVKPFLENVSHYKKCGKSSAVFIFYENSLLIHRSWNRVYLQWKCKRYVSFDVQRFKKHFMICFGCELISTELEGSSNSASGADSFSVHSLNDTDS